MLGVRHLLATNYVFASSFAYAQNATSLSLNISTSIESELTKLFPASKDAYFRTETLALDSRPKHLYSAVNETPHTHEANEMV